MTSFLFCFVFFCVCFFFFLELFLAKGQNSVAKRNNDNYVVSRQRHKRQQSYHLCHGYLTQGQKICYPLYIMCVLVFHLRTTHPHLTMVINKCPSSNSSSTTSASSRLSPCIKKWSRSPPGQTPIIFQILKRNVL